MAPPQGDGEASALGMFLPFILIFGIMYLFMIRPQVKKQKAHQAMLAEMKKGDKAVTTGGIHGKIVGVKEHTFLMQIAENTKIEVAKSAIGQRVE